MRECGRISDHGSLGNLHCARWPKSRNARYLCRPWALCAVSVVHRGPAKTEAMAVSAKLAARRAAGAAIGDCDEHKRRIFRRRKNLSNLKRGRCWRKSRKSKVANGSPSKVHLEAETPAYLSRRRAPMESEFLRPQVRVRYMAPSLSGVSQLDPRQSGRVMAGRSALRYWSHGWTRVLLSLALLLFSSALRPENVWTLVRQK